MKERDFYKRIENALGALSRGEMVIVVDDRARENEGDLVAVAEKTTPRTITFMATHGRGLICQPITAERAVSLKLSLMVDEQSDLHGTAFTVSVDHKSSSTGISAFERANTVKALADPSAQSEDFVRPGHIFPLIARKGGVLTRKGHTEAAVDLARLSGSAPSGVICEIMKDDGTMARMPDLNRFARQHGLQIASIEDLIRYRDAIGDIGVELRSESRLPTKYGTFHITTYTSEDPAAHDIVVLESGPSPAGEGGASRSSHTPLVRLHSECSTGEVFGSLRCDCGAQLTKALERIGKEGGALVYLKQEGRGIGLIEKIKAYSLQDEGADTVEANIALGHAADPRRFGAAAAVLKLRGYHAIRLLTNNPRKESAVRNAGIRVIRRESLVEGVRPENVRYLRTKAEKLGHVLGGV